MPFSLKKTASLGLLFFASVAYADVQPNGPISVSIDDINGQAGTAQNYLSERLTDGTNFYDARQIRSLSSITDSILAQQGGTWDIRNINGTISLPTGASTLAAQNTGNASLSSLDGKTVHVDTGNVTVASSALPSGAATSALQTSGNSSLTAIAASDASIDSKIPTPVSGRIPVDGSGVTQPVSAASLPLPSGASTSALQATGNSSLSSIDGKLNSLGQKVSASSVPVVIASDQSSVPVSMSSAPLPSGAATEATLSGLKNANHTDLGQINTTLGSPFQAGGSIANTSFQATQGTSPWVTSVSNFPATQAVTQSTSPWVVSGSVTATGSGNFTVVQPTGSNLHAQLDAGSAIVGNVRIDQTTPGTTNGVVVNSSTLPSGAATSALQTTGNSSLAAIDAGIPVALGAATTANSMPVNIASDQTVPVSAASLPLPSGAATSALQTSGNTLLNTINSSLLTIDAGIPATLGSATIANSMPVNIASDQTVPVSAVSLPLPAGAATSSLQTSGNTLLNTINSSLLTIDAGIPAALGAATTANSMPVNIASDQTVPISAAALPLPSGAATASNQTNGTQKEQRVDASGNVAPAGDTVGRAGFQKLTDGTNSVITMANGDGTYGLSVSQSSTLFVLSSGNSSTAQLAASATFTGSIDSVINQQAYSILLTSDQNGTLTINQYIDAAGTRKAQTLTFSVTAGAGFSRSGVINGNYFQVVFVNNGGSTTTTLNINTYYGTIPASTQLNNSPMALLEVNGVAVPTGVGASTTGTQRVSVANDSVVSTKTALTAASPTFATVGVTSAQAVASNANRKGLVIEDTSNNTISCALGATAVLNSGITLYPGGSWQMDETTFSTAAVNCIASAASSNLAEQEFTP